jgi:anti-sigma factor RsiW
MTKGHFVKMECIAPDKITDEQLLAYVDGEADSATVDHIRRCPYCARRAHAYAADQHVLRTLFYRLECPDAHTLGEYHLGLLSPTEQAAVKDHLEVCPLCVAEVAELEQFLQEEPVAPSLSSASTQLKRLVARLTPPSPGAAAQQPAFVLRGTAAPPDIYRAEDIRLVVGLEADGLRAGRKMLLGFTTRVGQTVASLTGAQVQLKRRGETVAEEQVDSLGNFVFSGLTSDEYELVLATEQEQVVVERIVV